MYLLLNLIFRLYFIKRQVHKSKSLFSILFRNHIPAILVPILPVVQLSSLDYATILMQCGPLSLWRSSPPNKVWICVLPTPLLGTSFLRLNIFSVLRWGFYLRTLSRGYCYLCFESKQLLSPCRFHRFRAEVGGQSQDMLVSVLSFVLLLFF